MHLVDAFNRSDLQCIQAIQFLSVCVFQYKEGCVNEAYFLLILDYFLLSFLSKLHFFYLSTNKNQVFYTTVLLY